MRCIVSSCSKWPRSSQKSFTGMPDMFAVLHAAISLSPCSPMMRACTLRGSTPRCSPRMYLKRAVSSTVPDPMTRFSGMPDSFSATCVRMSTGFDTTSKMPW